MELEEAKMEIVQFLGTRVDGKIEKQDLDALVGYNIGTELYNAAIKSLQSERIISEENEYFRGEVKDRMVLTEKGKEKYNLTVEKYVPERKPVPPQLRVVGTGGQTLGYTSPPSRGDCLFYIFGFVAVLAIVLFVVLQ